MRRALTAVTVVAGIAAAAPAGAAASERVIEDQYIVVLKPGTQNVPAVSRRIINEHDGQLEDTYSHALKGFTAEIPEDELKALRSDPSVASIEPDRMVSIADTRTPASWGLDRIDQRLLPLSNTYEDYSEGGGVHAYVIDTGIRRSHAAFSGRMGNGFDAVTAGGSAEDCNGHGTHVAGTVGGTAYGVADKLTLHPVRVLGCNGSGSFSGIIAGVDWVTANRIRPAVANMSLGGAGSSASLEAAVVNSINAGVTYAVAAGNSSANACNFTPARTPAAITVGATTRTDARAGFSNFGNCLDVFAPGEGITSAWHTSGTATNTISGTSMASPHVAGVAALYLSAHPNATAAAVRDAIVNGATPGKVTNPGTGSPNALLYNSVIGGPTPPPPPPPTPIVNGGFESGATGWTQTPTGLITTNRPRTGVYSAELGGADYANEKLSQPITVGANGMLTYHWQMRTTERSIAVAYDQLRVNVYAAGSGALLGTVRTWSNRNARDVWSADSVSLAAYAGQAVRLSFEVTTDYSLPTTFFVDDVSVS